jgi:phosphotransferase system enzyme I (PtsI)
VTTDKEKEEEIHIKGAPVSDGIAIGVPVFLAYESHEFIPDFPISTGEVEGEIQRYRKALSFSREDLKHLQKVLAEEGSNDAVSIVETHIQMLDDPLITTHMEKKIREMLKNTESVFHSVIEGLEELFSQHPDAFFREKLGDVRDLSNRVLKNLSPVEKIATEDIPPNSIIFAKDLIPSDTTSMQASRVTAFVTQTGGGTSHAALIARSKGIPYVASIDIETLQKAKGSCVIVDGQTGDIIINPSSNTLAKYEKLRNRLTLQYQQLEQDRDVSCETKDGCPIQLYANVNGLNDVDLVHHHGAKGIGLFRSEYPVFQDKELLFDEDAQYRLYAQLIEKAKGLSIVIRVLDLGGDKLPLSIHNFPKEPNPVLGCRGIRFLMRNKDIFRKQMRAILKASVKGDIRILIPLISDIQELRGVKQFIESVKQELAREGIAFKANIPLGCMLEVPSAILICDMIANECDFLSIGTNDLIQYTLGIDRNNSAMSDFYYPTHPSVVRMIKMAALEAKKNNKPISACGEITSNPLFAPLLVGLGVHNFSCASRFIPIIKKSIGQYTLLETCEIAEHVLKLGTSAEITEFLNSQRKTRFYEI